MREIEATYLVHRDEEGYPPTFVRFAPDEDPQRVVFSTSRYGLYDEELETTLEESDNEEEIWDLVVKARAEAGTTDDDEPRFYLEDAYMDTYEVPWFEEHSLGARWVSNNAWRGYEAPVFDEDHLEAFASGWVTGYPDETVQYKRTAETLLAELTNGEIEPPFEILWFFGVTSNVFSQTSDILVPAGKGDEFSLWLDGLDGLDSEAVTHAFN